MKFYLAGPMTGLPAFNYPAFFVAAKVLREHGYDIISPAEQDTPEELAHILKSKQGAHADFIPGRKYSDFLSHDVKLICDQVDGIIYMPGWQKSSGARLETFIALMCKKEHFALYRSLPFPVERVSVAWVREQLQENLP